MIEAVLFDFNGTLYFDQDINTITWKETIDKLSNKQIDFESFFETRKALMDYLVIIDAFKILNKEYREQEIHYWVDYKEERYRQYGIDNNRTVLPDGAEKVLNYLKDNNIPAILCTSSIIENVEFYYKYFNLDKWFNFKQTVYDTGEYNSKKQMYQECAKRLNVNIKNTVVFEDSPKSIKEAIEAGCEKLVIIKRDDNPSYKEIKQRITNYNELDYSIFQ